MLLKMCLYVSGKYWINWDEMCKLELSLYFVSDCNFILLKLTYLILKWTLYFSGYQIHVKGNGSAFHSNITLNATTTNFVLTNLSLNEEYSVRAVAFTTIGLGPFSPPTHFLMDPAYLKFTVVPTGKRPSINYLCPLKIVNFSEDKEIFL